MQPTVATSVTSKRKGGGKHGTPPKREAHAPNDEVGRNQGERADGADRQCGSPSLVAATPRGRDITRQDHRGPENMAPGNPTVINPAIASPTAISTTNKPNPPPCRDATLCARLPILLVSSEGHKHS